MICFETLSFIKSSSLCSFVWFNNSNFAFLSARRTKPFILAEYNLKGTDQLKRRDLYGEFTDFLQRSCRFFSTRGTQITRFQACGSYLPPSNDELWDHFIIIMLWRLTNKGIWEHLNSCWPEEKKCKSKVMLGRRNMIKRPADYGLRRWEKQSIVERLRIFKIVMLFLKMQNGANFFKR